MKNKIKYKTEYRWRQGFHVVVAVSLIHFCIQIISIFQENEWFFFYFIHKITHFCMVSISRQLNLKHLCKFLQDFFAYFYLNCIRSMNGTISCTFSSFIACAMKLKSTFKANEMFEHKNSISQHNLFWIFSRKHILTVISSELREIKLNTILI